MEISFFFLCLLGNAVATNENTEKQRVALFFCIFYCILGISVGNAADTGALLGSEK